MSVYTNLIFPLTLTAFLVLLFRPVALRTGLVDIPVGRKFHIGNTPLIGGTAVFCGLLVSVFALDIPFLSWEPLLAAAAFLLLVGLWDDYKGVGVRNRFLAQIGAVLLIAVWGGIRLDRLGDLLGFGVIELGLIAVPFTVFGPKHVALFVGDMFLVFRATEHIRVFSALFDSLIRDAVVQPPDVAAYVRELRAGRA